MNFSFTKRSRALTIVLIMVLMLSMLTGCFGTKDPDPTDDTQNNVPPGLVEVKPSEEPTEPSETQPQIQGNTATVIGDLVNVRNSPSSTTGNTVGHLEKGTVVRIIRTETSLGVKWALTESGWVAAEYLDFNYEPEFNDTSTPEETKPENKPGTAPDGSIKGVITATQLYIRDKASADGSIVGSYKKSDVVTITETKDGWGKTNKGWISMEFVSTSGGTDTTPETNKNNNKEENKNQTQGTAADIKGIVNTAELNIRKEPDAGSDRVGGYVYGNRVTITETKDGWGKTDKGWISLTYVYQDGKKGTNTAKGIVSGDQVNVRSGPGTDYDKVGSMTYGQRVNILEQFKYGNSTWACTEDGWVCLDYVYIDGQPGEGSGAGRVTGNNVNLRSGPGTNYESKGTVNTDDTVKILAQFTINGVKWGCTEQGWICMDYVDMTGFEG